MVVSDRGVCTAEPGRLPTSAPRPCLSSSRPFEALWQIIGVLADQFRRKSQSLTKFLKPLQRKKAKTKLPHVNHEDSQLAQGSHRQRSCP